MNSVGSSQHPLGVHRLMGALLLSRWNSPWDQSTRDYFRGRQIDAVARQLPLASVSSVLGGVLVCTCFWEEASHAYLSTWLFFLALRAAGNIVYARRRRQAPRHSPASPLSACFLTADILFGAALYVVMCVSLLPLSDPQGRILLIGLVTALIAGGTWMYAYLPQAGLSWALSICLGVACGIANVPGGDYRYLAALLVIYSAVMAISVLNASRLFLLGLILRTQVEEQRQVVENQNQVVHLLLRDFEENASDWLWEIDENGYLRHVSPRFAAAINLSADELLRSPLVEILSAQSITASEADRTLLWTFSQHLASTSPFRDLLIPAFVLGEVRWWSMTGKPMLDRVGNVKGWRGVGSDITLARQRELEILRLATTDTLTGLANRHEFHQVLEGHLRDDAEPIPCVVFLLDLDHFKTVNDSLGHTVGDRLLEEVARRLDAIAPRRTVLARLGCDEFALVIPGAFSRQEAEAYGSELLDCLGRAWDIQGHHVKITASIGAGTVPQDATNLTQLLRVCDMALYAAKAAGRNTLRLYHPDMEVMAANKLSLLSDLSEAIQHGDFCLHYQPQVDLATGHLIGFEALVRWVHPTRGMVWPQEFIWLAEESGLIVPLGAWVMKKACTDASHWPRGLCVAVNVSAVQFAHSDVQRMIHVALAESGLADHRLEVELTETALMQNSQNTLETLRALQARGVRIALDDFGTGYSSLSYLRSFPLNKLKIDRSFIENLTEPIDDAQSHAIVQSIIHLASAFQLETTAEGVETVAQREDLASMGCNHIQGHLIGRPLAHDEVMPFIIRNCERECLALSPAAGPQYDSMISSGAEA